MTCQDMQIILSPIAHWFN